MTLSRTAVSENTGNIGVIPRFSTERSFVCLDLESEHGTRRKYDYDGFFEDRQRQLTLNTALWYYEISIDILFDNN